MYTSNISFVGKGLSGVSESFIRHKCKAKYYPSAGGGLRLASVQEFSVPVFSEGGFEKREILPAGYLYVLGQLQEARRIGDYVAADNLLERLHEIEKRAYAPEEAFDSDDLLQDLPMTNEEVAEMKRRECVERAVRRAKNAAFDLLACNPDLDVFGTFTFDPARIDSTDYNEVYKVVRTWLSNRVQRQGLKYILVPERHADGEKIHFHCVFNSGAVKLVKARYNGTGRLLKRTRAGITKQLYNVEDWPYGFSSCEKIYGSNCTLKVAKYIFKYMGKQLYDGQKIGGRYFLHGGKLALPTFVYSDKPEEFFDINTEVPVFTKNVQVSTSVTYREWGFI